MSRVFLKKLQEKYARYAAMPKTRPFKFPANAAEIGFFPADWGNSLDRAGLADKEPANTALARGCLNYAAMGNL